MQNFAVAECERCADEWLIETNVEPDLLEGVCQDCQNDSDTEKSLTFRTPTKIEIQTMASPPLRPHTTILFDSLRRRRKTHRPEARLTRHAEKITRGPTAA